MFLIGNSDQMAFCRGTEDDYARWANVTGDDGWSWKNLLPFIFKVDRMTAPADRHDTSGQFDPAIHKNGDHAYILGIHVMLDDKF